MTILSNRLDTTQIVKVKILAPNGDVLRAGDCGLKHKADWYVRKNLASILQSDSDSFIIQLNFQPAGRYTMIGTKKKYFTYDEL